MFTKKIICFDIGATKILKAVVKLRSNKFEFVEIKETKNPRKSEKIRNMLLEYCEQTESKHKTRKVCISTAGIVDREKKSVSPARLWYGSDKFNFNFLKEKCFSVEVENDGRCFALGEYYFGKGRGRESLLGVSLGTGIGGGFIFEGKNFRGSHASAMEISFINFIADKKRANWDDFCAGHGIERQFQVLTGKKIPAKDIFLRYKNKQDRNTAKVIDQAVIFLGSGVATLVNILDPEIIVFGGILSKQKDFIRRAIEISKKSVLNKKANYKFAISTLGNRANLLGAASLYRK